MHFRVFKSNHLRREPGEWLAVQSRHIVILNEVKHLCIPIAPAKCIGPSLRKDDKTGKFPGACLYRKSAALVSTAGWTVNRLPRGHGDCTVASQCLPVKCPAVERNAGQRHQFPTKNAARSNRR